MTALLSQIAIAVFGVGALFLQYSNSEKLRRLAPWVGLAGQPAWIYTAYSTQQWGMLFVTLLYTVGWARGAIKNIRVSNLTT